MATATIARPAPARRPRLRLVKPNTRELPQQPLWPQPAAPLPLWPAAPEPEPDEEDSDDTLPSVEGMADAWLHATERYPLLSHEQHVALAQARDRGDARSPVCRCCPTPTEALVNHNLRLIVSVARRYLGALKATDLSPEDLWQYGALGLMTAAQRFDWRRGNRFGTMACWWIRQAISRNLVDFGYTVREPTYVHTERNARRKAGEDVRGPHKPTSLDAPLKHWGRQAGAETDTSLGDTLADPDEAGTAERVAATDARSRLYAALREYCTPREVLVLALRFGLGGRDGEPMSLQDVGDRFDPPISRERVRQIEAGALKRLRTGPAAQTLAGLLG